MAFPFFRFLIQVFSTWAHLSLKNIVLYPPVISSPRYACLNKVQRSRCFTALVMTQHLLFNNATQSRAQQCVCFLFFLSHFKNVLKHFSVGPGDSPREQKLVFVFCFFSKPENIAEASKGQFSTSHINYYLRFSANAVSVFPALSHVLASSGIWFV